MTLNAEMKSVLTPNSNDCSFSSYRQFKVPTAECTVSVPRISCFPRKKMLLKFSQQVELGGARPHESIRLRFPGCREGNTPFLITGKVVICNYTVLVKLTK